MEIARYWRLNAQRYGLKGTVCTHCGKMNISQRPVCTHCGNLTAVMPGDATAVSRQVTPAAQSTAK